MADSRRLWEVRAEVSWLGTSYFSYLDSALRRSVEILRWQDASVVELRGRMPPFEDRRVRLGYSGDLDSGRLVFLDGDPALVEHIKERLWG